MTAPLPMTTGRWVALAIGLPIVLALIGTTLPYAPGTPRTVPE